MDKKLIKKSLRHLSIQIVKYLYEQDVLAGTPKELDYMYLKVFEYLYIHLYEQDEDDDCEDDKKDEE